MNPNAKTELIQSLTGNWLMEPKALGSYINSIKAGLFDDLLDAVSEQPLRVEDGLAIIGIKGPMSKQSFWGASTVAIRNQVREAMGRDDVKHVLLSVESGGGSVAGTKELADDIKALGDVKPVTAYVSDIGASAAYWAASQAGRVVANEMAEIGSIGVVAVIEDTSGMYENAGIKVHVVSTGDMKGAFTDGAPVTDEMLADLQERVNFLSEKFKEGILSARDVPDLDAIADGRTFNAEKALDLGLIDAVDTMENVVSQIKQGIALDAKKKSVSYRLSQSAKR